MPDIAQGGHADLVLAVGDAYQVGTPGVATVVAAYGAPAGTTTITANTQTFGPYTNAVKLAVAAVSGKVTYNRVTVSPNLIIGSPFADVGSLPAFSAYPVGAQASYGTSAPYTIVQNNGSGWVASGGGSGTSATTLVATSRPLTQADNGNTLQVTASNVTLTVPAGLTNSFGVAVIPFGTTTSIASSGGTLLNGATTTVIRGAVGNAMFALIAKADASNSYLVTDMPTRQALTSNRTYYVATTGNDGNDGLTASTPFLTVAKAVAIVVTLDFAGYAVTVQLADGTYTFNSALVGAAMTGQKLRDDFIISGNAANAAAVVISGLGTFNATFYGSGAGVRYSIRNLTLTTASTNAYGIQSLNNADIGFQNIVFGANHFFHMCAQFGGVITATGAYTISSGGFNHLYAESSGLVVIAAVAVTLTGTPAFSDAFASVVAGQIGAQSATFTGTATGSRYKATIGGAINTNTGNASFLPGSTAGTAPSGYYN